MKERINYTKPSPDILYTLDLDIYDCCLQGYCSTFRVLLRGEDVVTIKLASGGNTIDLEVQEYNISMWRPGDMKATIVRRITDYANKHPYFIKEITNEEYRDAIYTVNPIIAKAIEEILK